MDIELALIDMDGTVYSASNPIDGVNKTLEFLRENNVDTFFLTNYAGRKRSKYSEKLEKMGLDISEDEVVTSGWLTAEYISQNHPDGEIFVLGEDGLKHEIREKDLEVIDRPEDPDVLVVSNKHDLSYEDLKEVLQGISEDTVVLGTNPDETIPGDDGEIPGAGTIIQAVKAMTGKDVKIIGKPSENAVETVTSMKGVDPEDCMMIGDRLNTDIVMGNENEMLSVLVLSGVTDKSTLKNSDIEPDYTLQSIADIPNNIQ